MTLQTFREKINKYFINMLFIYKLTSNTGGTRNPCVFDSSRLVCFCTKFVIREYFPQFSVDFALF
jgi:hypothetical protein